MPVFDLNQAAEGKIVNVIDILHSCDLFSAVEAAGLRRLATIARIANFRKGQVIFRENEPCRGAFVVGQGLGERQNSWPS